MLGITAWWFGFCAASLPVDDVMIPWCTIFQGGSIAVGATGISQVQNKHVKRKIKQQGFTAADYSRLIIL
jgi:hypothetical protein